MTTVTAAGATFELIQVGQGRDRVLLHSLLTDNTAFDAVVPALSRDHRLTLVNMPGYGASSPAGPAIEDYADRLAALFPALGLDPARTDLVGMSFGGFASIALAARHGHLFDRLVIVDAAAVFPEASRPALRAMADRALAEGMAAVVDTARRRMFTEAFIRERPDVVAVRSERLVRANPAHFATACRALASLDLRPVLGKIRNPTLVVVGTLDVTTPPALSRELQAGIAGARLVEIADAAHCPPLEKPTDFTRVVSEFLR
jgi:3-oxoadipate enol-lactonase